MCGPQVITKSVAQCVEFYYTHKKHVKIGRNGTLIYGEAEPLESRTTEEETDHKVSRVFLTCAFVAVCRQRSRSDPGSQHSSWTIRSRVNGTQAKRWTSNSNLPRLAWFWELLLGKTRHERCETLVHNKFLTNRAFLLILQMSYMSKLCARHPAAIDLSGRMLTLTRAPDISR